MHSSDCSCSLAKGNLTMSTWRGCHFGGRTPGAGGSWSYWLLLIGGWGRGRGLLLWLGLRGWQRWTSEAYGTTSTRWVKNSVPCTKVEIKGDEVRNCCQTMRHKSCVTYLELFLWPSLRPWYISVDWAIRDSKIGHQCVAADFWDDDWSVRVVTQPVLPAEVTWTPGAPQFYMTQILGNTVGPLLLDVLVEYPPKAARTQSKDPCIQLY